MQTELISRLIGASGLKVEAGGGIRQTDDIRRLLDAGASRVVVGTRAMEDWDWFKSISHEAQFAGKLVLAVDAKDGIIATRGWTESSNRKASDVAAQVSDWPVAALLYTDVSQDGMLGGPNIEQTRLLAEAGKVPVIASGGVGHLDHIRELTKIPAWGVILGRSLYEGKVDLTEGKHIKKGHPVWAALFLCRRLRGGQAPRAMSYINRHRRNRTSRQPFRLPGVRGRRRSALRQSPVQGDAQPCGCRKRPRPCGDGPPGDQARRG